MFPAMMLSSPKSLHKSRNCSQGGLFSITGNTVPDRVRRSIVMSLRNVELRYTEDLTHDVHYQ